MSDLENTKKLAEEASAAAVAADLARRAGSPDRATALRLQEDFIAAASARRFHEAALAAALSSDPVPKWGDGSKWGDP